MAYSGRSKDESKRRRKVLRHSRQSSRQQSVDPPVPLERDEATNQLLDQTNSSSVAHHELAVRGGRGKGRGRRTIYN